MTVDPLATGPLGEVLSLFAGVGGGDDRGEALLLGILSQAPRAPRKACTARFVGALANVLAMTNLDCIAARRSE